mgnify:CR=1 FL=1
MNVDAEAQTLRHSEAAGRGIPNAGTTPNRGCGRVALSSVILAKRGSPRQGQRSTLSFPRWNHLGDSRAERENDVHNGDCVPGCVGERVRGDQSSPSFRGRRPWNPQRRVNTKPWTREGRPLLRHPREAGIPHAGAGQYVVVSPVEPFGGFPRGARE